MSEVWADIAGYETRYQVSNHGRVRALPTLQRFVHWRTSSEMFRLTKMKILSQNKINSGYLIAHLYLDKKREALLVHRLVAVAFLGAPAGRQVNHKNGAKTENHVDNLEWISDTDNKLHAVRTGLVPRAIAVTDPSTGIRYDSISQAAKGAGRSHHTVSAKFERA